MLHSGAVFARLPLLAFLAVAAVPVCYQTIAPAEEAPASAADILTVEPRRPGALLYFFSPDWRPTDLGALTETVEQALAAGGYPVSFQAFTRYEDFERQIIANPPLFLLAPAWLEVTTASALGLNLTVIARPIRHGKSTYRKALMTRANIDSIDNLARGSIAATLHSMGPGDPATVLQAFHLTAESAKVVPVPKDVDALLALSFGQVDAALVTAEQYDGLAASNPAEAERLRVLAFSPEVKLPPVFASAAADAALRDRLRHLLIRLPEMAGGADVLRMLGFDQFVAELPLDSETEQALTAAPAPIPASPIARHVAKKPAPAKKTSTRRR
ncbi:MAG: PhnD/SsuA/transferrin family substrate-binding protein [Vicinamibacterales bacterium]